MTLWFCNVTACSCLDTTHIWKFQLNKYHAAETHEYLTQTIYVTVDSSTSAYIALIKEGGNVC